MTGEWGIRAGGQRSTFLATGVIELYRPGVGDLLAIGEDREAVKRRVAASDPKAGTIAAWAGAAALRAWPRRSATSLSILSGRRKQPSEHTLPWSEPGAAPQTRAGLASFRPLILRRHPGASRGVSPSRPDPLPLRDVTLTVVG